MTYPWSRLDDLHPRLAGAVKALFDRFEEIPSDRRPLLVSLADWIRERHGRAASIDMIFICTHNSRRSHIGSLWAQAAAHVYGITGVASFSGGTEVTAFNPRALAALTRVGFEFEPLDKSGAGDNPRYQGSFAEPGRGLTLYSKVYDDPQNPQTDFAAVMTCAQADEACPTVTGAAARFAISYEDPKAFDGTERENEAYDERVAEIGRDMLYTFSLILK